MIQVKITALHATGEVEIEEHLEIVAHDEEAFCRAVEGVAHRAVTRVQCAISGKRETRT